MQTFEINVHGQTKLVKAIAFSAIANMLQKKFKWKNLKCTHVETTPAGAHIQRAYSAQQFGNTIYFVIRRIN